MQEKGLRACRYTHSHPRQRRTRLYMLNRRTRWRNRRNWASSLVQAAKVRARGYRTIENFITMAYLVCGKLTFNLHT